MIGLKGVRTLIIEMRIDDVKPGMVQEYVKQFAAGLPHRQQFSQLAAAWRTEIGPLNRLIHVWPYADVAERERIRAAADKPGVWPPPATELLVSQESKIIDPAPFSPPLREAEIGLYEIRTYTVQAGKTDEVIQLWTPLMERRLQLSPCIFVGATIAGGLNQWVHVWGYKDLNDRARIRAEVVAKKIWWPPVSAHLFVRHENMIVLPLDFSPLK